MIERSQVELLAPAGDEECFKAAIAAGADAVYFGMEQFSARTRAKNITVNQAKYLIPLAHKNNCRAYLTLNTLIKDDEMQAAVSLIKSALDCGIDAVIVQDLGVLKVLHTCFPQLELHASTQMTTHNSSQCEYLSSLGVSQINLSRELSLDEIATLTSLLHSKNIVPEIFVQGAFCISYSGQCYLSGHLYGEAGNRGSCVQPCRRSWCPQNNVEAKDYKALFHLKDNSAYPLADKLIKNNVPLSLKIEGRIKNAEYVWAVTSAWREQIDLILEGKGILKSSPKLTGAINRDYTCGYLDGTINSQMFSSGAKDLSLVKAGTVKNYIASEKTLILHNDDGKLNKGDRLTIKTGSDQFICTAKVMDKNSSGYQIQITNKLTKKILNGQIIYKSSSVITPEELSKIINQVCPEKNTKSECCVNDDNQYKVDILVNAAENQQLKLTYSSENQLVTVNSEQPLVKAQNAGLTSETLEQKLTKLGGTCFTANNFHIEKLDSGLFISLSELNNLRRKAVELLEKKINENPSSKQRDEDKWATELKLPQNKSTKIHNSKEAYLIDDYKQLNQLLLEKKTGRKDYKIIYELPSAINIIEKDLFDLLNQNPEVTLYFNSILMKDDLDATVDFVKKLSDFSEREILCDNTGLAFELKKSGCRIILGPNCNIYNSWNLLEYKESLDPSGVIPSLELDSSSIEKLNIPENVELWYPKKIHTMLMQSRQCLVRNGSGCTKGCVDRNCIESCSKKLELSGTQNEKILAVKRKGFYSSLYTAELQNYVCPKSFAEKVSVWIIDKRGF